VFHAQKRTLHVDRKQAVKFFRSDDEVEEETAAEEEVASGSAATKDVLSRSLAASSKNKGSSAAVDADGYMPFKMPWSFSVSYGIIMSEDRSAPINVKNMRYPYKYTQNMNFSGNIGISDNWRINFTSGYSFENKKITTTTMNISRDLHCFEMSCGVVLSPYTSFNFSFRATSQMLADALKWDKRSRGSNVDWY
jgi:hypothetical protein